VPHDCLSGRDSLTDLPGGSLPPARARGAETADKRALGYIGTLWRAGKLPGQGGAGTKADRRPGLVPGHDLPEELLRTDWLLVERVKSRSEEPLRRSLASVYEAQTEHLLRRLREKQRRGTATTMIRRAQEAIRVKRARKEDPAPAVRKLVVEQLISWNEWADLAIEGGEAPDGTDLDGAKDDLARILEEGFEAGAGRIGVSGIDFSSGQPSVRTSLEDILRQTKNVQRTWADEMARRVQERLSAGDDFEEIIDATRDLGEEHASGYRLDRIVRTAGNAGFERGQLESFRKAGIKRRAWLTERDPRVRGKPGDSWDHRSADGQTQPVESAFFIENNRGAGESLLYPGAPSGSPGNTINCRCSQRPKAD